jgi:hypothetical protein
MWELKELSEGGPAHMVSLSSHPTSPGNQQEPEHINPTQLSFNPTSPGIQLE